MNERHNRVAAEKLIAAAADLTERKRRRVWLDCYDPTAKRRKRRHVDVGKASLVDLLEIDVRRDDDTSHKVEGGLTRGFASRPPGHYAPRELLDALRRELAMWLLCAGGNDRSTPAAQLGGLVGLADELDDELADDIARVLEQWVDRLRRYAGLARMFHPRTPCPQCDKVGALTVWVDNEKRRAERGKCRACGAGWDENTVGLLLAHIKGDLAPATAELVHTADGDAAA